MLKKLLIFVALLAPLPAFAQSVQYVTPVTRGHIPVWSTNGVLADGGTSASSPITSIGVTNNGGAGICVNSALPTAPGYNALCFGASTTGPATISVQNYGTAIAQGLNFVINGTTVNLPTGGGSFIFGNAPFTVGDVPCFASTAGAVQDCGLALAGGTVTSGIWQGTPVAIPYGGTGATSASGARTNLGLGTMATQNSNNVAITGGTITGMPTPVNPSDVAIKSYVDATATGLVILPQSALATTTVLPNTPTYANGSSGVGATLTAGTNSTITVDGTVATLNTIVLVKNQASSFQNGVYTVTTAGSGSAAWVLTRATYFDTSANMLAGSYTFVTGGVTNANSSYVLQTTVATVGTSAVTFNQFSVTGSAVTSIGGANGVITLGNGLQINTNALSTTSGVDTNTLRTATSTDSVLPSDCGNTIQEGSGSTGFYTITLPSVSGFNGVCTVNIKNGDTGRGKGLSGFPVDLGTTLWPLQSLTVKIINGAWATTVNPGRYIMTGALVFNVNHASGSDSPTVTDGLATGAGAFATFGHCLSIVQNELDAQNQSVTCLDSGENFTENNVLFAGQPVGTNKVFVTGAGIASSIWNCSTGAALGTKDNGEVIFSGFALRASGSCNTFLFAEGGGSVLDISAVDFGNISGNQVGCVGFGNVNLTGNYTVSGTAVSHVNVTGPCYVTVSGITVSMPNTISMTSGFYVINGTGTINSAPVTYSGAGVGAGTSGPQFALTGCGALFRGTSSIPGSIAGTPAAGTALTSSNCAYLN